MQTHITDVLSSQAPRRTSEIHFSPVDRKLIRAQVTADIYVDRADQYQYSPAVSGR